MTNESIFRYSDYKTYLRAYLKSKPRAGHGLLTQLAEHMDITSAQLSHVMRGERDFTFEQALRATKFLGLAKIEADYFFELVMYARASTKDLREFSKAKVEALRTEGLKLKHQVPQHRDLTDQERAIFYSSWMYSAVRLFSSIHPRQLEDVMTEFQISRRRASEILNFLLETGLCVRNEKGISMGAQTTFVSRESPFVKRHHSNWRLKGLNKSEAESSTDLFFTSPVSLSKNDFEKLRIRLTEVVKEFSAVVKESKEETVACLNIDFFVVTGGESVTD